MALYVRCADRFRKSRNATVCCGDVPEEFHRIPAEVNVEDEAEDEADVFRPLPGEGYFVWLSRNSSRAVSGRCPVSAQHSIRQAGLPSARLSVSCLSQFSAAFSTG